MKHICWIAILIFGCAGCATKTPKTTAATKTTAAFRNLPATRVPIVDTAKINPVQGQAGRKPWVPPDAAKAEISQLRSLKAAELPATNRVTIRPDGTGFRFDCAHATNQPGQIWLTTGNWHDGGNTWFLTFNGYDTPSNSTTYAPNFPNPYGRPPKIFGHWVGRSSSFAKSLSVINPSFDTQFAAAKKKLGRKAKDYGMRPDGTLVRLN